MQSLLFKLKNEDETTSAGDRGQGFVIVIEAGIAIRYGADELAGGDKWISSGTFEAAAV